MRRQQHMPARQSGVAAERNLDRRGEPAQLVSASPLSSSGPERRFRKIVLRGNRQQHRIVQPFVGGITAAGLPVKGRSAKASTRLIGRRRAALMDEILVQPSPARSKSVRCGGDGRGPARIRCAAASRASPRGGRGRPARKSRLHLGKARFKIAGRTGARWSLAQAPSWLSRLRVMKCVGGRVVYWRHRPLDPDWRRSVSSGKQRNQRVGRSSPCGCRGWCKRRSRPARGLSAAPCGPRAGPASLSPVPWRSRHCCWRALRQTRCRRKRIIGHARVLTPDRSRSDCSLPPRNRNLTVLPPVTTSTCILAFTGRP